MPKEMTPVRACQLTSQLLQRIDHELSTTPPIYVTPEERQALRTLRDLAARVIVRGDRFTAQGDRRRTKIE